MPGIGKLKLSRQTTSPLPACLGQLFPTVPQVTVTNPVFMGPHTLDLTPLAALPELTEVVVRHQDTALEVLADALPPHVTLTVSPRPRT